MTKANPFLKWVGGKSQLLSQFYEHYPPGLKNKKYFEPFIGGGAVFFEVIQKFKIATSYISDLNEDLILAYKTIQILPDNLLSQLEDYQKEFDNTILDKRNELFLNRREDYNRERKNLRIPKNE